MQYYVSTDVERTGNGTKEQPFATIQEAAQVAKAGDKEVTSYIALSFKYTSPVWAMNEAMNQSPLTSVVKGL